MILGRRIRVTGGPWSERFGCYGNVIIPTPDDARRYPFHGKGKNEEVIRLDDDPLLSIDDEPFGTDGDKGCRWTCVIGRADIELTKEN